MEIAGQSPMPRGWRLLRLHDLTRER
jgi:hypothetical protein